MSLYQLFAIRNLSLTLDRRDGRREGTGRSSGLRDARRGRGGLRGGRGRGARRGRGALRGERDARRGRGGLRGKGCNRGSLQGERMRNRGGLRDERRRGRGGLRGKGAGPKHPEGHRMHPKAPGGRTANGKTGRIFKTLRAYRQSIAARNPARACRRYVGYVNLLFSLPNAHSMPYSYFLHMRTWLSW